MEWGMVALVIGGTVLALGLGGVMWRVIFGKKPAKAA